MEQRCDVASMIERTELVSGDVVPMCHYVRIYAELVALMRHLLSRPSSTVTDDLERTLTRCEERLCYWRSLLWQARGLDLDALARVLRYGERSARLTRRETQLMDCLIRHHDRTLSAIQLASMAWGSSYLGQDQLRAYVTRLRIKMRAIGVPCEVVAVARRGYRLRCDDDAG